MTIHLMKCVISWIIPPGFIIALVETILDIPVQLLMNVLAKYIVIQVNNLLIRIENNNHSAFLFRIDYIIIDTERQQQTVYSTTRSQVNRSIFQEKHKLTINMRVGPIYIGTESNERSVGVITPSHVLAFYYFQPRRFCLQDLDLKTTIGEIVVDGYNCYSMVELIQKLRRGSASSSIVKKGRVKWENVINSNSLSISYINIVYSHQNPMVKGSIEISGINSIIHTRERLDSDQHPLGQLSANKIKCVLKQQQDDTTIAAFSLPNLEIKATYVLNSLFFTSGEPRSDFLFATIQLDSPLVTTNVVRLSQIMTELDSSSSNQPVEYKEEKQKMGPFKLSLVDIPACGLAFVLNKPRVEFTDIPPNKVPEKCLSGVLSANNLIVRLSGEYIAKSNRAGIADIPSSFSSSSLSSLDSFFVKQEYRWLNTSLGGSSSDLLQTNRNSMEFNRRGRDHILKRMSHRQGSLDFSRSHEDTRQWSYRWVGKIIFQKLDIGHHCQDGHSPLVYIKHAAIVLRSRMEIALDQDKQSIESTWSPGNGIQAEAAVEKPIIYIYNAQDSISSLVFWMSILPQFFARKQETTNEKREVSAVIKRIMRNVGFSLDVSRGSIIAVNADRKKTNKSSPPGGYVDNTPVVDVVSRIVFYTHKFTFVWESPESREETWREDASLNGIWRSRCFMEKLSLQQSSWSESNLSTPDNRDKNQHESYPIIWISQLNLSAKFTSNHKEGEVLPSVGVDIVFKVKKKGIQYSVRNHYACLLLVDSMKDLKRQFFLDQKPEELKLKGVPQKPSILFIQCISFQMERVDVRVMLPNNTPLYARVDGLFVQVEPAGEQPIISLRNMMLLGISPTRAHHWDQLIEVDKFTIDIRKTTDINLRAKKVFARIPYNYILADVIDNVIGLVKAIKDLHLRLGASEPAYTFFGPIPKNDPIMIPIICIRTDVFTLHFDDDPFEVKLRRILSTGKLEQERRLAYREAMDHKISELYEEINSVSPINSDSSLPSQVLSMSKVNELEDRIEQAENGLLKHYSESWLRHINKTIQEESHFYHQMHITENYRNPLIVGELDMSLDDDDEGNSGEFLLSNAFSIKILPLPLNPPLANFSSQLAKVKFRPADFPLTETRQFIHEVGRGVPLNTSFSIIIPFHLSIISGETWVKLRDYPLPLLYVPKNMETSSGHTTSTRKISWTLDGNYVLADDLGDSSGSRFIPIEIIPVSEYSPGYIIAAVRTASPLKFYSIIEYNVIPKAMSSICWSPSYNPVIQDIIHILDRLTPAQVDPSPRIGFWDKVRMMIHTRTTIHFSGNGDLAVVVKGTRNPYKLNENGKGLAKIWSNDVVCLLGYENPQKEILQVISVNYAFGVPDLIRGGYVPNIPDALPYTLEKIESNSESKFSKIALKLSDGIRMGIGLDFERLCCPSDTCSECEKLLQPVHLIDRCRSLTFSPHYDILFRSKSYVESEYKEKAEDYDAFKEFRSHFVHLAFSIVKLQKNKDRPQDNKLSGNSMYLSPCFVEHFMNWFRMFGSPLSLPVREGKLFPSGESSPPKKFGEHLNTIKYKICVNPLAIGYFCTEDEAIPDTGGSAGLKAIVSSFSVDLHQRREIVKTKFNDMEPVKTEMNFHEIELQLQEIDLRAVRAEYTQKTQPVKTNYHVNPNEEYQSDVYSLHNETSQTNYWIDSSDFVMLSIKSMFENPNTKINIHPFIFSPLFHYIRQSDEHGTEKRRYLRDTHECIMGRGFDRSLPKQALTYHLNENYASPNTARSTCNGLLTLLFLHGETFWCRQDRHRSIGSHKRRNKVLVSVIHLPLYNSVRRGQTVVRELGKDPTVTMPGIGPGVAIAVSKVLGVIVSKTKLTRVNGYHNLQVKEIAKPLTGLLSGIASLSTRTPASVIGSEEGFAYVVTSRNREVKRRGGKAIYGVLLKRREGY
ncbi:hypothetical protein K501DRAFT_275281 [Backusella circina FSU 941]|nr:hypothetical protein K501DRAFT_275281 [Backusella circina FSU 941]